MDLATLRKSLQLLVKQNKHVGVAGMDKTCTGIILAGGQNSRFAGANKALMPIGEKPILDHIYGTFKELFQAIILVTNDPAQYIEWDLNIVTDIFSIRSSLTGIQAGLFFATTPYVFVAACDTPFIKQALVQTILDNIEPHIDVVIPETVEGLEPLCSVYSKQCLKPITRQMEKQELKINRVFQKLRIKKLSEQILRQHDPELISFYNINTPEDLAKAQQMFDHINEKE